jgi:hypothetical protein
MARKKRVKRGTRAKSSGKSAFSIADLKNKTLIVINNLLLFVALFLVSFVLSRFLQNETLINLFQVMAMIFGFVSVAFLITLLILLIMKVAKKK